MVGETWYAGTADAGQNALNEIAYAYASAGRIVYEADNYASLAYAYNDAGQIVSTTTASAATPTVTIEYEYDASGRRTRMTTAIDRYLNGSLAVAADYSYDSLGRLVVLVYHQGDVVLASYAWTYREGTGDSGCPLTPNS